MLQSTVTRARSACNWAEIKAQRSPRRARSTLAISAARLAMEAFSAALPALAAAGHSLATIAFCLGVNVTWVLDQAVAMDLPTPSDRRMRKAGGKNPWTTEQIQQLVMLWPTNLYATCIAERIGRSPASVRYKAKWLGLPARGRATLVRKLAAGVAVAEPNLKRGGWTIDEGRELGDRHIRGQHTIAIAKHFRRPFGAVNSYAHQIGLDGRHSQGSRMTMDYDPAAPKLPGFENKVYRICNFNPEHWFWADKDGDRTSPASKKSKAYQDLIASGVEVSDDDFPED